MSRGSDIQEIIWQRAHEDYGLQEIQPSALAKLISERCALEPEQASALAWGERSHLEEDEVIRVAEFFSLHKDLLNALLHPVSIEVLTHILKQTIQNNLNLDQCPICADLAEQIINIEHLQEHEIEQLALEVLSHVSTLPTQHDEDFSTEEEMVDSMIMVFSTLDNKTQMRVLAYACQEASGSVADHQITAFSAYARLKQKHLSLFAVKVFDQLAINQGAMSDSQLMSALGLSDKRSLGQLRRSVDKAISCLRLEGIDIETNPLIIEKSGRQSTFKLAPEALRVYSAMLRAESSAELIKEGLI